MCIFAINLLQNVICICLYVLTNRILFVVTAITKTQWSALVKGRYMITMMVLLYYVNLSGMSLECM